MEKKRFLKGFQLFAFAFILTFSVPVTANAGFDESKPYNIDDVSQKYIDDHEDIGKSVTFQDYINNSEHWEFGDEFNDTLFHAGTSVKSVILKPYYRFNRSTGEPGFEEHASATAGNVDYSSASGKNNVNKYDNSAYICSKVRGNVGDYVADGMHIYAYKPALGTTIPLEGWKNIGFHEAVHSESRRMYDENAYEVIVGRWVYAFGIEFHSAVLDLPLVTINEQQSPCRNPNYTSPSDFFRPNSTTWNPICAVCGEAIRGNNYAPLQTVQELPVWAHNQWLICTCPWCGGLELGTPVEHTCKGLSSNKLIVKYDIGTTDITANGYLADDLFLYHGGNEYEAKTIKVSSVIGKPNYIRDGYTFAGWSTTNGASTAQFQPGQDISVLKSLYTTPTDGASITLYAVWKPNTGTLTVKHENTFSGGATYNGSTSWSTTTTYPSTITLNGTIKVPTGYTTNFNGNGGTVSSSSITAATKLSGSKMTQNNSGGTYDPSLKKYIMGTKGGADIVTFTYEQSTITLPSATKSGSLFIGWYTAATGGTYVGYTGEEYYPSSNGVTLYARFSTLQFTVEPTYYKNTTGTPSCSNVISNSDYHLANSAYVPSSSYAIHNAVGATTLHMQMTTSPGTSVSYEPYYLKTEGQNSSWVLINSTDGIKQNALGDLSKSFTTVGSDTYTVQADGIYSITAYGAQGGNYGNYSGGKGGKASGYYYLKKGDIVEVYIGGQNGTYGGGAGSVYGNGGGYSCVYINGESRDLILIAGGGGGATSAANGGAGGSTTNLVASGVTGQSGQAGGGGGLAGGLAGSLIYHKHDLCENHTHTGDKINGGACWQTKITHTHTAEPSYSGTDGQIDGCYVWNNVKWHSCTKCNNSYGTHSDGVTCNNCGTASVKWYDNWKWRSNCSKQYEWGLSCTKTEGYQCGKTTDTVESSTPGYGGSNLVHSTLTLTGTSVSTSGQKTGDGQVTISPVRVGGVSASGNHADMFGVYTPDTSAPDMIKNPKWDSINQLLTWETPESNGTNYNFMVAVYGWDSTSKTVKNTQTQTAGPVNIESTIAGYYVVYDNSATLNVQNYINVTRGYKPTYTWTNQYLNSSDSTHKVTFIPEGSSKTHTLDIKANSGGYTYAHVAAVDVAGNIGESKNYSVSTITPENAAPACTITFNSNALSYQINKGTTVKWNSWSPNSTVMTVAASGENAQGYYYKGYYSIDDASLTGSNLAFTSATGTKVSYGGAFPTITATGCTFLGWNSEADGSGAYYSHDGSQYSSGVTTKKLTPSQLLGNQDYGQNITLYAIWKENDGSSSISVTYNKPKQDTYTNIKKNDGYPNPTYTGTTITSGSTTWTNSASVTVTGKIAATGIENLSQKFKHFTHPDSMVKTINAGFGGKTNVETQADKWLGFNIPSVGDYTSDNVSLTVEYNMQGTINVYGSGKSVEKQYGKQGGSVPYTTTVTLCIDKTAPVINSCSVSRPNLADYSISEVETKIKDGILTNFAITVSDELNADNGPYINSYDSSGIYAVYLTIIDADNSDINKTYVMPNTRVYMSTQNGGNIMAGYYEKGINLYTEFPTSTKLYYTICAVDNAGNVSERSIGNTMITNFDIKTAIYNADDNIYNIDADTGDIYFQLGSKGRVEVWTVGFVEGIQFDFKAMGEEAVKEIEGGLIAKQYNMGVISNSLYVRSIPYTVATPICPTSIEVLNETNGLTDIINSSQADVLAAYTISNGVPYAAHYKIEGWEGAGTSIVIPPYYPRTKDGNKVHEDGTPQYKWENHKYEVIGTKKNRTKTAKSSYILWDAVSFDVHYRVIHQQ